MAAERERERERGNGDDDLAASEAPLVTAEKIFKTLGTSTALRLC